MTLALNGRPMACNGARTDSEPPRSRVLLLEDEPFVATAATMILEDAGYSVSVLPSCQQALAAFEQAPSKFDIAIVDQRLGDGSGVDVAHRMRALRPDLPILLCSGHISGDLLATCERHGMKALAKPFDVDDLLAAVAALR